MAARAHKKMMLQYYEVVCDGAFWSERYPPRRFLPPSSKALPRALAYAQQITKDSAAVATVDAVYRHGVTGQSTTPVAGFRRGVETFATTLAHGKASGVKSPERTGNGRVVKDPLDVPLSWKKAVLAFARQQIERKYPGESVDADMPIVARRLDRLVQILRFYKKNSDYLQPAAREQGPFDIKDMAALVIFKKRAAYKVARSLLGAHIADNHFHPDDRSYVNMDWFDFKLS